MSVDVSRGWPEVAAVFFALEIHTTTAAVAAAVTSLFSIR